MRTAAEVGVEDTDREIVAAAAAASRTIDRIIPLRISARVPLDWKSGTRPCVAGAQTIPECWWARFLIYSCPLVPKLVQTISQRAWEALGRTGTFRRMDG